MKTMIRLNREEFFVLAVVAAGFLYFWWMFSLHQLIYGVDGPYYLIQVKSILETGAMRYSDPPLVFYLYAFSSIIVKDVIVAIKLATSIICALAAIPLYYLMRDATGRIQAGVAAMLLFLFSAPYIRMMTDFMKNAVGVLFLTSFTYFLYRMTRAHSKRGFLPPLAFLALAGFSHVLDFGVAVLVLLCYLVALVSNSDLRRKAGVPMVLLLASTGVFILVASSVQSSFFTDFSKFNTFLADLGSEGESSFQLPLFTTPPQGVTIPVSWAYLIPVLVGGAILGAWEYWKGQKDRAVLLTSITATAIILSLPFIPSSWLTRFLLMEFTFAAIILSFALSKVTHLNTFIVFSLLVITPVALQSAEMSLSVGPTITQQAYDDLQHMKSLIPPSSIIVAPHGFRYWLEYVGNWPISGTPRPDMWDTYEHVFLLVEKPQKQILPPGARMVYEGAGLLVAELRPPSRPLLES